MPPMRAGVAQVVVLAALTGAAVVYFSASFAAPGADRVLRVAASANANANAASSAASVPAPRTASAASAARRASPLSPPLSSMPCVAPERTEVELAWARRAVASMLGGAPPRVSRVDEACPRFVFAFQNHQAGLGHRMTNWAMALHTAVALNLTFAHTSFDGGSGAHGSFSGWDRWLGFTRGEFGLDDVKARAGIREIELPGVGGYYGYNEAVLRQWAPIVRDPDNCNVAFKVPQDAWMYDISSLTRALMATKFAEHAAPKRPKALAAWDARDVNVAVHVRFGDQYPTPEHVHARVIAETVLPALREARVRARVAVHVFAEEKVADRLPFLAALAAAPAPATAAAAEKADAAAGATDDGGVLGGVAVFFHPEADPMTSFWHLTQSDFLVGSFSSFSWAAAQVALRPLALMQPSSDIMRMCGESSACCHHDGSCGFFALHRTRLAAQRLAQIEACAGALS